MRGGVAAAAIGLLVLRQEPRPAEVAGIGLIVLGIAGHRAPGT